MALPNTWSLKQRRLDCYSSSIGGTPVIAYQAAPFRGRIAKVGLVAGGVITTADATITVKNGSTTIGTFTLPVASAAAGQLATGTTSTAALAAVNEDDVISFTPSGASGASIPGTFFVDYVSS